MGGWVGGTYRFRSITALVLVQWVGPRVTVLAYRKANWRVSWVWGKRVGWVGG